VKSLITIELFEEHDKVNFYTIRFQDEETEVDKFLDQFPEGCKYDEDIDIIIKWIEQIGERSALERYFRYEGKPSDHVFAIPIETSHLRLYVIRLSEHIVIIGNGGVKTKRTYNDDPFLNSCVELLQEVDGYIKSRIQRGQLSIYQKQLFGNLKFHLKDRTNEK
jgi:hypothetical protein